MAITDITPFAETTCITLAEAARQVRKVLRLAFPQIKMSIHSRHSQIEIEWEDTGPSVEQVRGRPAGGAVCRDPDRVERPGISKGPRQ